MPASWISCRPCWKVVEFENHVGRVENKILRLSLWAPELVVDLRM